MASAAGILPELAEFLDSKEAHSLIIKGPPGSGKTTLARELCEVLGPGDPPILIGSRESNPDRIGPFKTPGQVKVFTEESRGPKKNEGGTLATPWIDHLLNKMAEPDGDLGPYGAQRGPVRVEGNGIVIEERDIPWIDEVIGHVRANWPRRSTVVLDSIDGLAENDGLDSAYVVRAFQHDLVESVAANVIFVAETFEGSKLDYMCDGVVRLSMEEFEGRRVRTLLLEKLRSVETRQPRSLFTLHRGEFQSFRPWQDAPPREPERWTPIQDPDPLRASWGWAPFDQAFSGLRRGTLAAIECAPGVSPIFTHHLVMGLVANFVTLGRGVAFLPPKRATGAAWRALFAPLVGSENWNHKVVTLTPEEAIDGVKPDVTLKWEKLEYRLQGSGRPLLSLIAFDTLESLYGANALDMIYSHIGAVNRSGDIFVALTNPLLSSNAKVRGIAHVHVRIENLDGSVVLFGEKPRTELFHASFSLENGAPEAVLTPIV